MSKVLQNDDLTPTDEIPRLQRAVTAHLLEAAKRRWLAVPQAALELDISEAAVRTLCRNHKIEHKREGTRGRGRNGTILIERRVIEAYNAKRRQLTPRDRIASLARAALSVLLVTHQGNIASHLGKQ